MSKPYFEADLSDQFDSDISWRIKELSDLKAAVRAAPTGSKAVLLRALVAILYAHWEGHVRFCTTKYFHFVTLRKFQFSQVHQQFYVNSFLAKLDGFFMSRAGLSERCNFIDDVLRSKERRFSRIDAALIDTKSNLNSNVLADICKICGISFSLFESEVEFIDLVVLKRRNSIAHGEEQYVDEKEMDALVDRMLTLMRTFRNELENHVYTKAYLAPAH